MHYFFTKKLTPQAQSTQIIPAITNSSLLSIGQLCDDNCTAVFNKRDLKNYKDNDIIVKGQRNLHDGLWDINLPPFTHHWTSNNQQKINAILQKSKTKCELANFIMAVYAVRC